MVHRERCGSGRVDDVGGYRSCFVGLGFDVVLLLETGRDDVSLKGHLKDGAGRFLGLQVA